LGHNRLRGYHKLLEPFGISLSPHAAEIGPCFSAFPMDRMTEGTAFFHIDLIAFDTGRTSLRPRFTLNRERTGRKHTQPYEQS